LGSFRTDFGSVSQNNSRSNTRSNTRSTAANGRIALTDYTTADHTTSDYTTTE
jgi:hypothetical protein